MSDGVKWLLLLAPWLFAVPLILWACLTDETEEESRRRFWAEQADFDRRFALGQVTDAELEEQIRLWR